MKAVEFKSTVNSGGQIGVPPELAQQIPAGEPLQVIVLWEGSNLEVAWRAAGRERFEAAYAPEDSVYEQLIDDAAGAAPRNRARPPYLGTASKQHASDCMTESSIPRNRLDANQRPLD